MDSLSDDKNNPSASNIRPNRFSAVSHFLIGIGVFVMCAGILSFVGALISGISMADLQDGGDIFSFFEGKPIALQLFVFFSSSLPFILAALLIPILFKASPKLYLQIRKPENLKWFILSIVFIIVAIPLLGPLLELNKLIDFKAISPSLFDWLQSQEASNNKAYEAMIGEKTTLNILSSILFMALLPAIAEELFFRGFLMNVFNGIFRNMHVAILLSALAFSIIHMQFLKAIPMFFLAVIFGYAVYWTGSIFTSIIAHFLNNTLAVVQLYFFTDGNYTEALDQGPSLPLSGALLLSLLVIAMFIYINKNTDINTQNFYVQS